MTSIPPPLVSCQWLHEKIDAGNLDKIVIIDASWSSTKDCLEEFKKAHIPGAQHINMLDAAHTELHPRNIPSAETFTTAARQAGINDTSHVIIYSDSDRAGFFLAGRSWWTFRLYGHNKVSILDGGLEKWRKLGYQTTSETPEVPLGNFTANRTDAVYKGLQDVKNNIDAAGFQLVDTRTNKAFSDGHIPNAHNIPLTDLIDHDNIQLKPVEDLKKSTEKKIEGFVDSDLRKFLAEVVFSGNNVDLSKPIATHCNSGMSSCSVAFVGSLLGVENVAVFHGGFTEWTKTGQATTSN